MNPPLCRFLRWKGFYGRDWDGAAGLAEQLGRNEVQFSCLKTCQPWGPDDSPVAPEACDPLRACFTPSPIQPVSIS